MKSTPYECANYRSQILKHFIDGQLWDSAAQSLYGDCIDCIYAVTHALNAAGREPTEDLSPEEERELAAAFRAAGLAVPPAVAARVDEAKLSRR